MAAPFCSVVVARRVVLCGLWAHLLVGMPLVRLVVALLILVLAGLEVLGLVGLPESALEVCSVVVVGCMLSSALAALAVFVRYVVGLALALLVSLLWGAWWAVLVSLSGLVGFVPSA